MKEKKKLENSHAHESKEDEKCLKIGMDTNEYQY